MKFPPIQNVRLFFSCISLISRAMHEGQSIPIIFHYVLALARSDSG